jgi:eukaryotic-like serine/threonine-protein kinase
VSLTAGTKLGPYEIVAAIGAGGMGEVYRARDPRLDRDVAIKVLPDELAGDADLLARFDREARAASALNHPNIVTIYETGRSDGVSFIAMELVDGWTLTDLIAPGPMEISRILELGSQIAEGLAKAHAAGIVHRDLKPANVMVSRDGFVKLLDFGIARRAPLSTDGVSLPTPSRGTEPGTIFGTIGYMSPEQATGRVVDARSDQFSFGAILYEMTTGRRAFERPSPVETLLAILKEEPEPVENLRPSAPPALRSVIARCLAKEAANRYGSTRELANELKALMGAGSALTPTRPGLLAVTPAPARPRPIRAGLVTLGVLVLAAATLILSRLERGPVDSLAVLPFATPSSDPEAEYLGQGLADDLIERLSRLPDLRVIARSSVSRYRNQAVDPQRIGRELGVRAVLTGSVEQRGDHLVVSAELVDARRNAHLWGQRYDRELAELMGLQHEIAQSVSETLRPDGASASSKAKTAGAADPRAPTDAAAYRSYLKGRYHWNKRTETDSRRAIAYFQEAIDRDPGYAAAYDGLSDAWLSLGWYGYVAPREAYPRAQAAARRAVALDGSSADGHASLAGIAMWYDWDWSVAEREFARMLELSPTYATGRHWHADLLSIRGLYDEAIAESRRALELDPLSLIINTWLGRRYYFARRYDDAARECRKALELDPAFPPAHWQLGSVLLQQRRTKEAIAELETAARLSAENPRYLAYLGHARATSGDASGARAALNRLDAIESGGRNVSALDRALIHAGLGDRDRALEGVEKALEDRPSLMPYLGIDPLWDPLRASPRFRAVLARLELAPSVSPASPPR